MLLDSHMTPRYTGILSKPYTLQSFFSHLTLVKKDLWPGPEKEELRAALRLIYPLISLSSEFTVTDSAGVW